MPEVVDRSLGRSALIGGVVALGVILTAFQFTTLEYVKAILAGDPTAHAFQAGLLARAWSLLPVLRPIDWGLVAALAGTLCVLAAVEIRWRRLSHELGELLASERGALALVAVLSAVACRFYLAPGEFALGDSPLHVANIWTAAESLSQGQWPSWSYYSYGGFPFLQFYGAGFFVLIGSFVAASGSLLWTTKGVLFLFHVASALPIYAWVRAAGLARASAVIAATAYTLSFLHTHTVVWTGALPVAFLYLLFPATLWMLERALTSDSRRWLWALAAATFLAVGTHHGYAAYWLELLAVYLVLRVTIGRGNEVTTRRMLSVLLAILGGVVMNGGPLLRMAQEGSWVHLAPEFPILRPAWPDLQFVTKALTWNNAWSGWSVAYVGLSIVGLALVGAIRAFRPASDARPRNLRLIVVFTVFAFLCAAGNERLINLALVFTVFVAGSAVHARTSPRVCLAILALLVLDLGPTTIQSPYRADRRWLTEGLGEVARAVGPHRTLVGYSSGVGVHYAHWGAYSDTRLIVPTGFFPQGAPQSLAGINALVDAMNAPDSDPITRRSLLYLWDVSALVVHSRDRFTTPEGEPLEEGAPSYQSVGPASPLLFSRRVAVVRDGSLYALQRSKLEGGHTMSEMNRRRFLSRLQPWIRAMGVDPEHATADVILISGDSSTPTPESIPTVEDPSTIVVGSDDVTGDVLEMQNYQVDLRRASISFRVEEPGYARLAFSYYPSLRLTLDGQGVRPMSSLLGAMILPVDAGAHTIVIQPADPWRLKSLLFLLAGLLIVSFSQAVTSRSK